ALLSRWKGKLFVLVLLGFVATDFIITITLSAADASAHILQNPFVENRLAFLEHPVVITLVLITLLGAVFIKGFKEAIGLAVILVAVYLFLNLIVIGIAVYEVALQPELFSNWRTALFQTKTSGGTVGIVAIIGLSLLVFPRLALGLSGFETGVAGMPLIQNPGRIQNTTKLLATAALIMSFMLIASSLVTSMLIPKDKFCPRIDCSAVDPSADIPDFCACTPAETASATVKPAGDANGRALSFIAHLYVNEFFGTIYDISTFLILWFAGALAMAGLLNIVPRYLPRYGMAP